MRNRTLLLMGLAMVMFAGGAAVQLTANDAAEHVLGGLAILGAVAIVIAHVSGNGNGKEGGG